MLMIFRLNLCFSDVGFYSNTFQCVESVFAVPPSQGCAFPSPPPKAGEKRKHVYVKGFPLPLRCNGSYFNLEAQPYTQISISIAGTDPFFGCQKFNFCIMTFPCCDCRVQCCVALRCVVLRYVVLYLH